jgi:hypothetical protein
MTHLDDVQTDQGLSNSHIREYYSELPVERKIPSGLRMKEGFRIQDS